MVTLTRGDFVVITVDGRTIRAMVTLASADGRSLVLMFDGVIRTTTGGAYAGLMPVYQRIDGRWTDLVDDVEITIRLRSADDADDEQ